MDLSTKRRRLFFDIETSFNLCGVWSIGNKVSIGHDSIIKERAIICICWKWEGEKKVNELRWNKGDDSKMLEKFIPILETADEIVGHNVDNFDLKFVRTRAFKHGIPMMPKYQTIDTYKMARSYFRFNSNRLDYISKFSGERGKIKTSWDWWLKIVLYNDQAHLDKMVRYCKRDVVENEKDFHKLKKYIPAKFHYAVKSGGEKRDCPECGSTSCRKVRRSVSAAGEIRQQLVCNKCGKHHTVSGKNA